MAVTIIVNVSAFEAPVQSTQVGTYTIIDANRVDYQGHCGKYSCTKTRLDLTVAEPTATGTKNTVVVMSSIDDHLLKAGKVTLYRRGDQLTETYHVDYTWRSPGMAIVAAAAAAAGLLALVTTERARRAAARGTRGRHAAQ